eukprot:scaffold153651_cov31-Tisochrysis_lutea.AAC.3
MATCSSTLVPKNPILKLSAALAAVSARSATEPTTESAMLDITSAMSALLCSAAAGAAAAMTTASDTSAGCGGVRMPPSEERNPIGGVKRMVPTVKNTDPATYSVCSRRSDVSGLRPERRASS